MPQYPDVVCVDADDQVIGAYQLFDAEAKGLAVRIARVFLQNSKGELLIQQRNEDVLFPKMWDQSAAGHVDVHQTYETAAVAELEEEMGIVGVPLEPLVTFYTEERDGERLWKRHNQIFTAVYDGPVKIEPKEVLSYQWCSPAALEKGFAEQPNHYCEGFVIAYGHYKNALNHSE